MDLLPADWPDPSGDAFRVGECPVAAPAAYLDHLKTSVRRFGGFGSSKLWNHSGFDR